MPAADLGVLPIAGVEVQPAPSRSPSLSPLPDAADTTGPPNLGAAPHQLDSQPTLTTPIPFLRGWATDTTAGVELNIWGSRDNKMGQ